MLPKQPIKYPEFVADQLLTADNLNDLFGYLSEEGRLTRTNLIGIGIVCGLEVKTSSDGTSVTITKGCGVTSEGYLIEIPETKFEEYKPYNALKEVVYDRFAAGSPAKQVYELNELIVKSSIENFNPIEKGFLDDKVVLIFVELLRKDAKNCDPDSCDDKGVNITVTFRPLVVSNKQDLTSLLTGVNGINGKFSALCDDLPAIPLPRFDVPATKLATTIDVVNAYQAVFKPVLLADLEGAIGAAYKIFKPFVSDIINKNPYENLASFFAILKQENRYETLFSIQYYYDLLSDIIAAYNELREKGAELIAECCPDSTLFPRHLLLGNGPGNFGLLLPDNRHHFLPSPAFQSSSKLVGELRALFTKLVLLIQQFSIPGLEDKGDVTKVPLRITPSQQGKAPLSARAIPYYYSVEKNSFRLLNNWNYNLTRRGKEFYNLSYHADRYTEQHKEVLEPLSYDIEPYDFFRIEGIIGKDYKQVMSIIKSEITENRLPFDVIALRAGDFDSFLEVPAEYEAYFDDLSTSYEIVRREWEAIVGQTIEYIEQHQSDAKRYIDYGHRSVLTGYIQTLYNAKTFLFDKVMDFVSVHEPFMDNYNDIEVISNEIRRTLYNNLPNGESFYGTGFQREFVEDLIDHIDAIALNCEKGAMRSIYQLYAKRAAEVYKKQFLVNFLEKNPGIQHKAGVPTGGTFIVVYNHNKKRGTVNANVPEKGEFDLIQPVAPQPTNKEFEFLDRFKDNLTKEERDLLDRYIPSSADNIPGVLRVLAATMDHGVVIADFFVPYNCCTDGSGISFVISDAPPRETLTISIDETAFCNGDDKPYKLTGKSEGGTWKGEGVKVEKDGTANFYPSLVKMGSTKRQKGVLISYTREDARPAITSLNVFAKPKAAFEIEDQKQRIDPTNGLPIPTKLGEYSGYVHFTNTSVNGDVYSWDFGDGSKPSTAFSPKYNFNNKAGKYKVTLTVTNGLCKATITKELTIVATSISLIKNKFCNGDESNYEVLMYPPGYNPSGEGLNNYEGRWAFNPSSLNSYEQERKVTLYLTAGGQTATFDLVVYRAPDIDISVHEDQENTMMIHCQSYADEGSSVLWDFGDGNTSTKRALDYIYKEPGTYTVKLRGIGEPGACEDRADETVVNVTKNVVKKCSPFKDILTDYNTLRTVAPPQYKNFSISFPQLKEITDLFALMGAIEGKSNNDQLNFFIERQIPTAILRWITTLDGLIRTSLTGGRLIHLALYHILMRLTMYISCIQRDDSNVANSPTYEVFQHAWQATLPGSSFGWGNLVANFAADEKLRLKAMGASYALETSQIINNGEDVRKYTLMQQLNLCIQAIQNLNLG